MRGFSLIEVMVALLLSSLLMLGVVQWLLVTRSSYEQVIALSEQHETGVLAKRLVRQFVLGVSPYVADVSDPDLFSGLGYTVFDVDNDVLPDWVKAKPVPNTSVLIISRGMQRQVALFVELSHWKNKHGKQQSALYLRWKDEAKQELLLGVCQLKITMINHWLQNDITLCSGKEVWQTNIKVYD